MHLSKSGITALIILSHACFGTPQASSQTIEAEEIKRQIQQFKQDPRGPYQAIRWFCPDGSVIPANQKCKDPGGIQHALWKDTVKRIADQNGIFLGQILAGTGNDAFWNATNLNARLKQYQLEKYLQAVDDGWIVKKARYYRGAVQVEDEEMWGLNFLQWLVAKDDAVRSQFFLLRQAVKSIPHQASDNRLQTIRVLAKVIADSLASFMDIRVKIHGQPDEGDLQLVRQFRSMNPGVPKGINQKLNTLENELAIIYKSGNLSALQKYTTRLPDNSETKQKLEKLINTYGSGRGAGNRQSAATISTEIASLLWGIRSEILTASDRLVLFDLSNELESIFFLEISKWQPETLDGLMKKGYALAQASAGTGYLEIWEWQAAESQILHVGSKTLSLEQFLLITNMLRRVAEWGAGMVRGNYDHVVFAFAEFEPLAIGFIDDMIRSSSLLALGAVCGKLSEFASHYTNTSNYLMNTANPSSARGLNPGFAVGQLQVVTGAPEAEKYDADKIYVLLRPPEDLKPVAGIMTVSEGNLVSHVQLLARNLGIPNATLSRQNLEELVRFSGQRVFLAVSIRGTVIMKPFAEMNAEEQALITVAQRSNERIAVPTDRIRLDHLAMTELKNLRAVDSGGICGPKAANLGQLKSLFPERVVNGFIIPFGLFRKHLDQPMPDTGLSYWDFLQQTFSLAGTQRRNGRNESEIEALLLSRLGRLREAIKSIPLLPDFQSSLQTRFKEVFGRPFGSLPVFVRSDTNMEDLKDFTGAGLNLTVFNVVEPARILQGIKDVWASPFTERSYRWRQKYLLNPENVFPSILILPSVAVDNSGVMITSGVSSSDDRDLTIAFSRGAGGAVEGQAAETYLLKNDGKDQLLAPSREMKYNTLPVSGGTQKVTAFFDQRILDPGKLRQLRELAGEIKRRLPGTPGISSSGPFDIELGFEGNKLWLFQVRPYVENKRARSTGYLQSLDPHLPPDVKISLSDRIGS